MSRFRPILERYVSGYLEEVTALSYGQLADYQSPPFATLACGAAGIAYALWRAGRRDRSLLAAARRWTDEALAGCTREDAFVGGGIEAEHTQSSLFYGPAGLDLCDALISQATGDEARAQQALGRFAVHARAAGPVELMMGGAGFLSGASLLAAWLPAAGELEGALMESLAAAARDALEDPGMAHGDAGLLFASLHAAQRRGRSVPRAVRACLDRLATLTTRLDPPDGRWCNGSAGYALLFAKAHEVTGEAELATVAHRAALDALDSANGIPDLCCGAVGSAYAMLALSRIDPGGDWRRRAEELAMAVMVSEIQPEWAHGLFKGEAGTFCLAMDLLSGETRFPCLEA
ncbi:MAG TPA: lanthionine synthetase LanC family protein [Kofleriaceae bacterium]|nr:lanthionine synthetase LanC family protein [Kofleriaceae bacterium]